MTPTDWTNAYYQPLLQAAKNISQGHDLSQELLHYSLEQLLLKPNLQEIIDSGGGQFYVIRIMMNSWRSTTSPFYTRYRDTRQIPLDSYLATQDIPDEASKPMEEAMAIVHKELADLYWYDRQLFTLYVNEGQNISGLAKSTGIPRTSISLTLKRVRRHLRHKITKTHE